jgi:hypothetical protein
LHSSGGFDIAISIEYRKRVAVFQDTGTVIGKRRRC